MRPLFSPSALTIIALKKESARSRCAAAQQRIVLGLVDEHRQPAVAQQRGQQADPGEQVAVLACVLAGDVEPRRLLEDSSSSRACGLACPLNHATVSSSAASLGQSCSASSAAVSGHSFTSRGQRRANSATTAGSRQRLFDQRQQPALAACRDSAAP